MTKLQKKFFVGASLLMLMASAFAVSCAKKKPGSGDKTNPPQPPTSCSASINQTLTIDYKNQCTVDGACTLTFPCTNSTQMSLIASSRNSSMSSRDQVAGSIPKTASSTQFTISSITTVGKPALLQTAAGAL